MSKKISLLLLFGMVIFAPLSSEAAPGYDVAVPGDYKTVKEAVERGMPGDTIAIGEGTYKEKDGFKLKTDMNLVGAGADKTILEVGGEGISVSSQSAKLVNIAVKGLSLRFDKETLEVSGANGFTISNCILTSKSLLASLKVDSSVNVKVVNCTFADSECGLRLWRGPSEIAVRNSIFYNNKIGINILSSTGYGGGISKPAGINEPRKDISLVLAYNDFYNAKDFENCQKGEKDITRDPAFVAPKGGDFHLNGDSPCIGAGDPDPKYNGPDGSRNDMGALPYSKGRSNLRAETASTETLNSAKVIQGIAFPAGTEVEFYGSGQLSLARLAKDQKIKDIDFKKGTRLLFYETGNIRIAVLRQEHNIQGIPCIGDAYFYKSGKLNNAILTRSIDVQGLSFSKGSRIGLLQSGKIHGGALDKDQKVQDVALPKGADVYFGDSGKLFVVYLPKDQDIQGFPFAAGKVFFFESGKVSSGILSRDTEINGIKLPKGSAIDLYPSAKLKSVSPSKNIEIQGMKFGAGSIVPFLGDGKLAIYVPSPQVNNKEGSPRQDPRSQIRQR